MTTPATTTSPQASSCALKTPQLGSTTAQQLCGFNSDGIFKDGKSQSCVANLNTALHRDIDCYKMNYIPTKGQAITQKDFNDNSKFVKADASECQGWLKKHNTIPVYDLSGKDGSTTTVSFDSAPCPSVQCEAFSDNTCTNDFVYAVKWTDGDSKAATTTTTAGAAPTTGGAATTTTTTTTTGAGAAAAGGGTCSNCADATSGACQNPANNVCYAANSDGTCPSGTTLC